MLSRSTARHSYNSIIAKVIFLLVLLNLLISSVLYYEHAYKQKEELFYKISDKSRALGSSIVNTVEAALKLGMPLHDLKEVDQYLSKKLSAAEEVDYLVLTDTKGEILAKNKGAFDDSFKDLFKKVSREFIEGDNAHKSLRFSNYLDLPIPITYKDQLHGFIHVGLSDRAINNRILAIFYDIALIVLASLIIGYEFISYLFLNSIVYPVRDLLNYSSNFARRDFSKISSLRSQENISGLLADFNGLISWLTERFDGVKK